MKSKDDFVAKALKQDLVKAKVVSQPSLYHLGQITSYLQGLVCHLYHWDKNSAFFCFFRLKFFWAQILCSFYLYGIQHKMVSIFVVACINDIATHTSYSLNWGQVQAFEDKTWPLYANTCRIPGKSHEPAVRGSEFSSLVTADNVTKNQHSVRNMASSSVLAVGDISNCLRKNTEFRI